VAGAELHCASTYANQLLADLGSNVRLPARAEAHPALRWAASGSMYLTGFPDAPPQMCPVPLASYADGVLAALAALGPAGALAGVDGARLLGERAALAGYRRAGDVAPGGACRLLRAADGYLALNLARAEDWELLPAWLEAEALSGWDEVAVALRTRDVHSCVVRGRLLGLALAAAEVPRSGGVTAWYRELQAGQRAAPRATHAPRVIDLSSLWAGPLCAQLLQQLGAQVTKVESLHRPDGLRASGTGFYQLLNRDKQSLPLDFTTAAGRAELRQLLLGADLVIEASRPRALRQLGIHAEEILAARPGLTWLAISGHGREEPEGSWVAFGDDAAVAGGLSQVLWEGSGRMMFCGDAIADPLTGLHAALAAWCTYLRGGGRLLSIALRDVVAHAVRSAALGDAAASRARMQAWADRIAAADIAAPAARA